MQSAPAVGASMSWPSESRTQDNVVAAPFDMGRGGGGDVSPVPNRGPRSGPEQAQSAASETSLGNLRNTYAEGSPEKCVSHCKEREKEALKQDRKNARRHDRFELQRVAARLTPSLRVSSCLWAASASSVGLVRRAGGARFTGLQTCGSVWSCPCCSSRISEVRRGELRQLEEWAGSPKRGLRLVMMTLTARHRRRPLRDMTTRMGLAKQRMQNLTAWKKLRQSGVLAGTVSVREATYGDRHGWHPHYHVLCLVRAGSDEEAAAILEPQRKKWLHCLRKEGLTGTADRAFHLQNGDAVSAYISKHGRDETDRKAATDARPAWSISEEMTLARTKRGKAGGSRSPWQILRDAAAGDEAAVPLWQEYALVMHGLRQQVWSDGLKAAIGLGEVEDEDAAEAEAFTDDLDEEIAVWSRGRWRTIRHMRAGLLAAAEAGGAEAVQRLLDGLGRPEPDEPEPELIDEGDAEEAPVGDVPAVVPGGLRDMLARSIRRPSPVDTLLDQLDGPAPPPPTAYQRRAAIDRARARHYMTTHERKATDD